MLQATTSGEDGGHRFGIVFYYRGIGQGLDQARRVGHLGTSSDDGRESTRTIADWQEHQWSRYDLGGHVGSVLASVGSGPDKETSGTHHGCGIDIG